MIPQPDKPSADEQQPRWGKWELHADCLFVRPRYRADGTVEAEWADLELDYLNALEDALAASEARAAALEGQARSRAPRSPE